MQMTADDVSPSEKWKLSYEKKETCLHVWKKWLLDGIK